MEYFCPAKFGDKCHVYTHASVLDYKDFLLKHSPLSVFITSLHSQPTTIYHSYGTNLLAV